MNPEEKEKYEKAIEISKKIFSEVESKIKEGVKLLELAEFIENRIIELGAEIAFPVNLSINEIAAHYTPDKNDKTELKEGDLIKVDIGIHVDGYIADRARTFIVGEKSHELIRASEEALKEALKIIKPGNRVYQVAEVIEEVAKSYGFNPVRNLSGHGLGRYKIHTEPTILNGRNNIQQEFKEGQAIAMEVFMTNGLGWVKESLPILIYELENPNIPVRFRDSRLLLNHIVENYKTLPFAKRWISILSPTRLDFALSELVNLGILKEHPILKEKSNGWVAQTEETILL